MESLPEIQRQYLRANDPYAEILTNSLTSRPTGAIDTEIVRFQQGDIEVPHLHALQFKFSYGGWRKLLSSLWSTVAQKAK